MSAWLHVHLKAAVTGNLLLYLPPLLPRSTWTQQLHGIFYQTLILPLTCSLHTFQSYGCFRCSVLQFHCYVLDLQSTKHFICFIFSTWEHFCKIKCKQSEAQTKEQKEGIWGSRHPFVWYGQHSSPDFCLLCFSDLIIDWNCRTNQLEIAIKP